MNSLTELFLSLAIRASAVLIASGLSAFALRRASASTRRLIWIAASICLLALPAVTLLLPPIQAGRADTEPAPAAVTSIVTVIPSAAVTPATQAPRRLPWMPILWVAGAALVLARLAAGAFRLSWLRHRAHPIDAIAAVPCFESDRIFTPMTFGVFRPSILLPASHRLWPPDRLRLVRAHEFIHVQQRDCLFQLLMQFACALYWYHPLIWIAAAQFRKERECACDDGVLGLGVTGPEYAGHLLELARTLQPGPRSALAVAMASQSHLESRLVALLDAKVKRGKPGLKSTLVIACIAAGLLLPVATLSGQAQNGRGTISGVVYDASGAVNPHGTVLATNLDSNIREAALANEAGEYSFRAVPAGHYQLDVSSPGFKMHRAFVTLKANESYRQDIILEIGNVNETVEVVGKKPAGLIAQAGVPHRIRVGGNVVAAQLVSKVSPIYPAIAEEKGIEGTVLLEAVISTEGNILSLKVVNSANADLVRAATTAVQQWHYQPTLLNGQPVEVVTTVTVDFRLRP